jgi:phosphoribosylglycinamide formyltransferase-1
MNLAIFLSGTGTNFKAIAAAVGNGDIPARITLVASNKPDAPGLEAAKMMGLNTIIFQREEFPDGSSFAEYMLEVLKHHDVQLIVLAGYLRMIPPLVVRIFRKRIINIHPALLPDFGGKGMYGMNVHRAVIGSGVEETGVTVHYVDEKYDHGEIIAQQRVPVMLGDTPETLAARVLKVEHEFYPQVIMRLVEDLNRKNESFTL